MSAPADTLIAAIRKRGSDATDMRDAAHEAHHAILHVKRGPWTRQAIDRAVQKALPVFAFRLAEELDARSVEQLVCADLGVACWTVEDAVAVMLMESVKFDRVTFPPGAEADCVKAIRRGMESKRIRRAADRVIALGGVP